MEKGKRIIFKLLIVLISVFFIDGGKSLLIVSNNIQIIFNQDHTNDFEIPHQHHLTNFSTDEKWLNSFRFDFSCFDKNPVNFLFTLNTASQDFSDSIWQPPKFV
ncbi:MAG: hypothetical protein WC854_10645 [Bacteroidales bacterium]